MFRTHMAEVLFSIGAIYICSLFMSFPDHVKECLALKLNIVQKICKAWTMGLKC